MSHLTTRDGARLHYLDVGFGRGPACALLHGFGMQGAVWLPVIAPLPLKQCAFRRSRLLIPIEASRVFWGMSAA
ncbi:MAG: hypothetical protein Q8M37_13590 [Nevskia sp.]|nr:hypothetical protein [Nevskia sp.]